MANAPPVYFPSIYDKNVTSSPENTFNIWKKLGVSTKVQTQPQGPVKDSSSWPPGLADIAYEPISFFSSPTTECQTPGTSQTDKLCELEVQIKELELLTITGETCDPQKYQSLKEEKDKLLNSMTKGQNCKNPSASS